MSTTAVRMTHVQPHSASAYIPRSSRPSSPSLPPPPAHLPAPPNRHYSHAPAHHQPQRSHHRSASVPGSPVFTPRMQDMERRGSSHLRHEVTDRPPRKEDMSEPPRKEDMSEGARAILKVCPTSGNDCGRLRWAALILRCSRVYRPLYPKPSRQRSCPLLMPRPARPATSPSPTMLARRASARPRNRRAMMRQRPTASDWASR